MSTLREKLKDSAKCLETTKAVLNMIRLEGTLTGSTVWGLDNQDSDVDVILPVNCTLHWGAVLNFHNGVYPQSVEDMYKGFKRLGNFLTRKHTITQTLYGHLDKTPNGIVILWRNN